MGCYRVTLGVSITAALAGLRLEWPFCSIESAGLEAIRCPDTLPGTCATLAIQHVQDLLNTSLALKYPHGITDSRVNQGSIEASVVEGTRDEVW